jgi:hypothetical protein
MDDRKFQKSLEKMKALSSCQETLSKIVLSNVHRRSKSIKKLERQVSESLRRRKVFLEESNFEIVDILQ